MAKNSSKKQRIVVKVGTKLLTDGRSLKTATLRALAKAFSALHSQKVEVILVSSGAVGAGMGRLGWKTRPKELREKQMAAAVGQVALMGAYHRVFEAEKLTIAQVLLTRSDLEDRERCLNARATLLALVQHGVVPIINENDTVVVEEIRFGDNDLLAAQVASKVSADLLILFSDVDGFYPGGVEKGGSPLRDVFKITDDLRRAASHSGSELGTGGMTSKLKAAEIAMASGIEMVLANGDLLTAPSSTVLRRIVSGEPIGTRFHPERQSS